ncbi:MAG: glycosyltransferase family 4 protein [Terriglobia bacterium]
MATIAIDATYVVDRQPSGISTYSRRLIETLAALESPHRFLVCYRLSRLRERRRFLQLPPAAPGRARFSTTLFQERLTPWLPWKAKLFHSLAQRPPAFRFRREVVTINDVFPITGKEYSTPAFQKKFASLLLESARRASLIITPSQYTATELMRVAEAPSEKVRVIPPGVDLPSHTMPSSARLAERERRVGKGNRLVLLVGAIQTRKNTCGAVRALEGMPSNYRMVLAGSDGHRAAETHNYIRRAGLGGRVTGLGYLAQEELARLYQAADVLLFPSFEEGFGFPVLEAMAFGVPVVAAQASSLPEVGGDAALYVNPYDERDIREQVVRAVEDEALRRKMIAQGIERAKQFTWRRTAEETLKAYDEVLAGDEP